MNTKTILAALALTTAATALPASAQPASGWGSRDSMQSRGGWNRDEFWRGAPDGLQQRIDWLQQRIDRGVADRSMSPEEARRTQYQLNVLRRDANLLNSRLDELSRSLRWARRDSDNRYDRPGDRPGYYRDPYVTEYDASRYYRDDPRYSERRLSSTDEVYRGSDGRYYCKRNDGTTGLVLGGVGGAVIGNVIDGGHDRVAGTLIGGALGALVGKSIDQNSDVRCR
ncbi:MAG: glycine zipper 2TM domain-containing protein [Novosphingobium sp.]